MSNVHVVNHPLVQHKLTLMRDKTVSTKGFRQLMNEIGMLLAYEVTRDLPLEMVEVETPLARISSRKAPWAIIVCCARLAVAAWAWFTRRCRSRSAGA